MQICSKRGDEWICCGGCVAEAWCGESAMVGCVNGQVLRGCGGRERGHEERGDAVQKAARGERGEKNGEGNEGDPGAHG